MTPVDVLGLAAGVVAVASGTRHTCALTHAGGMSCWGGNGSGQLGDGTSGIDRLMPVEVAGLQLGVAGISVGDGHTCVLNTAGGLKCWGYNGVGQIGDGTSNINRLTPVDVYASASGMAAVSSGGQHTCALTTTGGAKCWGYNGAGQVGDGTSDIDRLTPVNVSGLGSGVAAISSGDRHTCALTFAGGVKCWGRNTYGEVGDGTSGLNRLTPVDVSGLQSEVVAISAGGSHTCALTTAGGVKCWGSNSSGQIGDATSGTNRPNPTDVSGLAAGVTAISSGWAHTCALITDGGLKCWGYNGYGQVGDGARGVDRLTPVDVSL